MRTRTALRRSPLVLAAALAGCTAPRPIPDETPPTATATPTPTPMPANNTPVMVGKQIVDPATGTALHTFAGASDHEFAVPAEAPGQYWLGPMLCDVASKSVLRTRHDEFRVDADKTVVRSDPTGAPLWSSTPGERVGSLRAPEILADDKRVYVAVSSGIAVLDGPTGQLQRILKGPQDHLALYQGRIVAVDCTSPGARPDRWLVAHDGATGAEAFRTALPTDEEPETPVVVGDDLLVRGARYSLLLGPDGKPKVRLAERVADILPTPAHWLVISDRRIFAMDRAGKPVWELAGFAENFVHAAHMLALPDGDLLLYNFGAISDSGVELVRLDANGRQRWRARVEPAGVDHSEYYHRAYVSVQGDELVVVSQGSYARFLEVRDARTGAAKRRYNNL